MWAVWSSIERTDYSISTNQSCFLGVGKPTTSLRSNFDYIQYDPIQYTTRMIFGIGYNHSWLLSMHLKPKTYPLYFFGGDTTQILGASNMDDFQIYRCNGLLGSAYPTRSMRIPISTNQLAKSLVAGCCWLVDPTHIFSSWTWISTVVYISVGQFTPLFPHH